MGLVNSSDKSLVMSVESMEATEEFSRFAETWITPTKRGISAILMPERILPGVEENNFSFNKTIPEDSSLLVSQLGGGPSYSSPGHLGFIQRRICKIELTHQINQATFETVNDELVSAKSTAEILLSKIDNVRYKRHFDA